jgi:hypothetical protein
MQRYSIQSIRNTICGSNVDLLHSFSAVYAMAMYAVGSSQRSCQMWQETPEIPDSYHTKVIHNALNNHKQLLEAIQKGIKAFYGQCREKA